MEVDPEFDWRVEHGTIQNKNNVNDYLGSPNKLQRCFRCSKPYYYNILNLLQHNLTHLQVCLEKLPDELFQFDEQDPIGFEYENTDIISDKHEFNNNTDIISDNHEYNNTVHSDIKSEIGDVNAENNTNDIFCIKTQSKSIIENSNIEFATKVKQENVDNVVTKFKIEDHISENTMDCYLDVEQLNKIIEHNNNEEINKKLEYYASDIIKYEVEDNSTNLCFDSEKNIEDNNNIKEEIIVIKIDHESNPDEFEAVENLNYDDDHHDIESETKIRLQRFDSNIIKCEIEEIDTDNSNDGTDQLIDVENTQNDVKEISDTNTAKKIDQCISNSTVVKSEIDSESFINSDIDSDTESIRNAKVKVVKRIVVDVSKLKKSRQCYICKKFISYKHLGQHISEVHEQGSVECSICSKVFKCRKTMRSHVKNVHRYTTFECDLCKTEFKSKDCLQKHIKNVHGKSVKCELCGSQLASEMYLSAHKKRVHYDDGKVHSCDVCGKIFKSPRYVRVHMKNAHRVSSRSNVSTRKKKTIRSN